MRYNEGGKKKKIRKLRGIEKYTQKNPVMKFRTYSAARAAREHFDEDSHPIVGSGVLLLFILPDTVADAALVAPQMPSPGTSSPTRRACIMIGMSR